MINLMPKKYKVDKCLKYISTISAIALMGVAALYPYLSYRCSSLEKEIEKMSNGKTKNEELIAAVAEKYVTLDALEKELEEIKEKNEVPKIDYSYDGSFVYKDADFKLSDMLLDFAFEIPEDIKIYTIRSVGTTGVIIRAVAEKQESVGAFVLNLESKTWIHDMSLRKIEQRIRNSGYKYYAFEIEILTDGTKTLKDLETPTEEELLLSEDDLASDLEENSDSEAESDAEDGDVEESDAASEEATAEPSEEEVVADVEVIEEVPNTN